MTVGDYLTGNITDKYGCHHWTWFATNGKSAEENFRIQKEEHKKRIEAVMAERRAKQEETDDIANVTIRIKTEVR